MPRPPRRARARAPYGLVALTAVALSLAACTAGTPTPATGTSAAAGGTGAATVSPSPSPTPTPTPSPSWPPAAAAGDAGNLAPGSDPSVLPAPIIIADKKNNRLVVVSPQGQVLWQWPQPGDLAAGQTFRIPDDVFFSPDGKDIIATEEDDFVITEIDIATRTIVWRYGTPGTHGSGPNQLWNPDDAMMLPDGTVIAADIKNCRLVDLSTSAPSPLWTRGTLGSCAHNPPVRFGSPNGVFPLPDGHFLVTEINGSWVDEIDRTGHVYWSTHVPAVTYPSDSNQYKPGQYLTVGYTNPGQAVIFDATGKALWRWNPSSGAGKLDHPSLAEGLPNGDIMLNDDYNHRVIVIDPTQNKIVWQYGHTGVAGSGPGYLNNPDGIDVVPPHSYAATVGTTQATPGYW
jgi:sugar lactone lactonase YvrE